MLRSAFQRRFACARVIRVCAFHKQCIFGRVVEDHMNENDCGKIAREQRLESAQIRQEFALDAFIVMPNHLHGILWILGAKGGRVLVNGGFGQPIAGADGVRPPDAKTPVGASRARPLAEPRSPFGRAALALWPSRARPLAEPRSPFGRAALALWPSHARPLGEPRSPLGRATLAPWPSAARPYKPRGTGGVPSRPCAPIRWPPGRRGSNRRLRVGFESFGINRAPRCGKRIISNVSFATRVNCLRFASTFSRILRVGN